MVSPVRIRVPPLTKVLQNAQKHEAPKSSLGPRGNPGAAGEGLPERNVRPLLRHRPGPTRCRHGEILCVLDTKYKDTTTPSTDDGAQIVAYAEKMGCQEAIRVYPRGVPHSFEARVGDIRVRSLSFSLEGDVDEAGHRFMRTVLGDAAV